MQEAPWIVQSIKFLLQMTPNKEAIKYIVYDVTNICIISRLWHWKG
jgi:hypothetical protein